MKKVTDAQAKLATVYVKNVHSNLLKAINDAQHTLSDESPSWLFDMAEDLALTLQVTLEVRISDWICDSPCVPDQLYEELSS